MLLYYTTLLHNGASETSFLPDVSAVTPQPLHPHQPCSHINNSAGTFGPFAVKETRRRLSARLPDLCTLSGLSCLNAPFKPGVANKTFRNKGADKRERSFRRSEFYAASRVSCRRAVRVRVSAAVKISRCTRRMEEATEKER